MLTTDQFDAALRDSFQAEIKSYPAHNQWASRAGHPCDRFLVWVRTRWQEMTLHDAGLQAIFGEGHIHQPAVIHRLEKMGFEITETDRPFQYAGYSGRIDGKIKSYNGERLEKPIPIEIKSCSPHVFSKIDTEADIANAKEYYIRAYRAQLTLYMLMDDCEQGYYIFKSKTSGWLKLIPSTLDWTLADALVKRSQEIDRMVAAKIDPDPIPYADDVCGRCGFMQLCYPPKDFGEGAELITDQTFIDDLTEWERLKPLAAQYDALDKSIGKRVNKHPLVMAGDFVIEGKEIPRKGFTVEAGTTWRKTIRRLTATQEAREG